MKNQLTGYHYPDSLLHHHIKTRLVLI